MEKTIRYSINRNLNEAATAYIRRNALVLRAIFLSIAIIGIAVVLFRADSLGVTARWVLICVSMTALVILVQLQIRLVFNARRKRQLEEVIDPQEIQLTFSDEGFYHFPEHVVPWDDVTRVRHTRRYWALHFKLDGREAFEVIPTDALDDDLQSVILERTGAS